MASRKNVLRLVLVAGLAALLSGCHAHGGGRYGAPPGADYAYGGSAHYAPYHGPGRVAQRRHGYRYRGW